MCSTQVLCPKCGSDDIKPFGYSVHNVPGAVQLESGTTIFQWLRHQKRPQNPDRKYF